MCVCGVYVSECTCICGGEGNKQVECSLNKRVNDTHACV